MKPKPTNFQKGKVHYNPQCYKVLEDFLNLEKPTKVFILADTNTHEFCVPHFFGQVNGLEDAEIVEIEPGEQHKNIETCSGVWNVLSELGADRKSLIINIGGGVVTDLGGFVASTFMRGIKYINVPTSLLAMVDASVGGKTGVDLGSKKNQIGVINPAELVLIDTTFLATLPTDHMRSGLAEILKHGLIQDEKYWIKTTALSDLTIDDLDEIIKESVEIKKKVVLEDPEETGLRKTLNFGHTLGHAIESYFLENEKKPGLLHGDAVAAGMVMACHISAKMEGFPEYKLQEISSLIFSIYQKLELEDADFEKILYLMKFDKKNSGGNINFVLLKNIGKPVVDRVVSKTDILNAFNYYRNF